MVRVVIMEFWIGLSVGMHLASHFVGPIERLACRLNLLSSSACVEIDEIEEIIGNAIEIVDCVTHK